MARGRGDAGFVDLEAAGWSNLAVFVRGPSPHVQVPEEVRGPIEIVVIGTPPSRSSEEDDFERHDCDQMGCGQCHVALRGTVTAIADRTIEDARNNQEIAK